MSRFYLENDRPFRDHDNDDCEIKKENKTEIRNVELAQAYVPFQKINRLYRPKEGLYKGTIFPELYKPYKPCEKQ